ncbi:unannotated protein [freshwater metagenome]|uniref:Unannotated protein n=1 Tax=freshwater metagenome TaxID=449393 RepID=A0A6J7CVB5_9ZZZZ
MEATIKKKVFAQSFTFATLACLLVACGPVASPGRLAEPSPTSTKVQLAVGVLAPLTGDNATQGVGLLQSISDQLALRSGELGQAGIELTVIPLDDRGESSVGQQQATRLPDDPRVVGVIGSVSSLVNESVQPIMNNAGIAMVAVGGGDTQLTQRGTPAKRAFATYFRFNASDTARARACAIWTVSKKFTRVLVVDDGLEKNRAMSAAYSGALTGRAKPVLTVSSLTSNQLLDPPPALIRQILKPKPQLIVIFGPDKAIPVLHKDLRKSKATFLTPAPLVLQKAVETKQDWAGINVATIGAHTKALPLPALPVNATSTPSSSAASIDPGLYAAAGVDALNLIIDALVKQRVFHSATSTAKQRRAAIVSAISTAKTAGLTGAIAFDQFGQVVSAPVGFETYSLQGVWVDQPTVVVSNKP